jgi:transcriptional regulator with XRE-family HTH domain
MENIENIGKRLKELRESRQLTLDMVVYDLDATYEIELTKGNLSRWENGKNYPSLYYAAYLAKYYGVSVDYLIGNTDIKTPVNLLTKTKKKD